MFRIAITGDDDVLFQWRATFDSPEAAQAQVATAAAEYKGHTVTVQVLTPIDDDNSTWVEVDD